MSDTVAADGTFDTSDTGGSTIAPVSSVAPLVVEEGRAFRSDEETRALVNAAYGVADADVYSNPDPEPQVGAPVETPVPDFAFDPDPEVEVETGPDGEDPSLDDPTQGDLDESVPVVEVVEPVEEPVEPEPEVKTSILKKVTAKKTAAKKTAAKKTAAPKA